MEKEEIKILLRRGVAERDEIDVFISKEWRERLRLLLLSLL